MSRELRQELHQNKPFRSLEQEAHLSIVRTAALLSDDFEQILAPYGLSTSQYNVLRILQGAEPGGLCRNEVRDRMLTRMPDMTRLLDRMEQTELVTRTRSSEDRRMVATHITDKGREILAQLDDAVAEEHKRRLGHMSKTDLKQLIDLLGNARDGA